jgi:dihydroneopterin aldolase
MTNALRVVKVGGSLFDAADMPQLVHAWIERQPAGITVVIGGGGDLVQPLRSAQERFRLRDEDSHWLAVRAMTVTSRLLAQLLNVELVEQFDVIQQLVRGQRVVTCVLDVEEFLRRHEPGLPGRRLPLDWSCTSDSIAARVAAALSADELILMKSVAYPANLPLADASATGLVDGHFPSAVAELDRLRWVNLIAPDSVDQEAWIITPGT